MGEYDIYQNGKKIGEIRESQSGCATFFYGILGVLLIIAIVVFCARCSDEKAEKQEATTRDRIISAEQAYIRDIKTYLDEVNVEIDLSYEYTWMEENYPDVLFSSWHELDIDERIDPYEGSFSPHSYCCEQDGATLSRYGDFITLKLDAKYTQLEGAVYLSKKDVNSYLSYEENFFYNNPNADEVPYRDDDFGLCVVFVDDRVVYESPLLRPYDTLSDEMSIDISGGTEIVICIVGLAYLGSPLVSK